VQSFFVLSPHVDTLSSPKICYFFLKHIEIDCVWVNIDCVHVYELKSKVEETTLARVK